MKVVLILAFIAFCTGADPCSDEPCKNGGLCELTENDFKCICKEPFSGHQCEKVECPCVNGQCVAENGKAKCICNPEYGFYRVGLCKACNCGKGANCFFDKGFFAETTICICPDGFLNEGEKCVAMDSCTPNPCQNEGTCNVTGDDFQCSCKQPYSGKTCEIADTTTTFSKWIFTTDITQSRFSTLLPSTVETTSSSKETFRTQTTPWSRFTSSFLRTRIGTISPFPKVSSDESTPRYRFSTHLPTTEGCRCQNGYCSKDGYGNQRCICKPEYGLYEDDICIPCNCGSFASCEFERNGLRVMKKHCICEKGFKDINGTCVELCHPKICIHGKCEIWNDHNFCRCNDGYKGVDCNEKTDKVIDNKILEIIEIQAPWILLSVLLLIILVASIIINRNKNIKRNSFFFMNSDDKCPLFDDPKFVNRLQTEVLE